MMKRLIIMAVAAVIAAAAAWGYDLRPVQGVNGKYGFVNNGGYYVVKATYDEARQFVNDFAAVCRNGKWGFLKMNGSRLTRCVYQQVYDFDMKGYAVVKRDGKWGAIDRNGNEVVAPVFEFDTDLNDLIVVVEGDKLVIMRRADYEKR